MSNTLDLQQFSVPESALIPGRHTWPIKIVAVSSVPDLPSEIFVYQRRREGDKFSCVASVHQLSELGTEAVVVDDVLQVPYYRRSEVLFHCRSADEADALRQEILQDAEELLANFRAMNLLKLETTTRL